MNLNFELILFCLTVVSGLISLCDILFFEKSRKKRAAKLGLPKVPMPFIADYARSFFPVLLLVFILRSFLFEPFRIPSGSLEPSLLKGDFILVNKFKFGVRLPIIHKKILNYNEPERGDVIVFRWPPNPSIDFIKRVIGLPGDHVKYIDKKLYINNQEMVTMNYQNSYVKDDYGNDWVANEQIEDLSGVSHHIYNNANKLPFNFYDIVVPKGMYFVMGDNRDDSADSRFWGFVPEEDIVGKAEVVWMSWNSDVPTIRWQRIGTRI